MTEDLFIFLYAPKQIYNLYSYFKMSEKDIEDFIYKLEKIRLLKLLNRKELQ